MKNSSWKPEEEVLLVNLYFDLKKKGIAITEAEDQIKSMSATLSHYAHECGYGVDDSFRNVTGIKMKLHNIEYIDTNCEKELSSYSRLDKFVVDLYKTNNVKFLKSLSKANKMIFNNQHIEDLPSNNTVLGTGNKAFQRITFNDKTYDEKISSNNCQLIDELKKLKKSSKEAVDNEIDFSDFKKYMHVHRQVETDLIETIRQANNGKKSLILLCGNVGDGKSHLISYLKNCQNELVKDYKIHNDATESYRPDRDEKQQLALVLEQFSDDNLDNGEFAKVIVAINLGVLSNFMDSEEGSHFKRLAEYVEQKKILVETDIADTTMDNGPFYCVNFGDYHIYRLAKGKVESPYIESIIEKIIDENHDNVFYSAYCKCNKCEIEDICPVKRNFEFLQNKTASKGVVNVILETIIKDKIILSTRDLLNFFYDIIVSTQFSKKVFAKKYKKGGYAYIADFLLPNIMFEHDEVSPLISHIKNYDFATQRTEQFDNIVTVFYNTDNIDSVFNKYIIDTTLSSFVLSAANKMIQDESNRNKMNDIRSAFFKIFARLSKLSPKVESNFESVNPEFNEYISLLYSAAKSDMTGLKSLYTLVRDCVYNWNGSFDTQTLNLHSSHNDFSISTPLECKGFPGKVNVKDEEVFERFPSSIDIKLSSKKDQQKTASVAVDYDLYKMLKKVKSGYRPSIKDENLYAGFVAFIKNISAFGESDERIIISYYENEKLKKYMLELDEFGSYVFREA